MRVRRAQARLRGRDARAPGTQTYPCKPIKGEGIRWLLFVLGFGWLTCPRFRERVRGACRGRFALNSIRLSLRRYSD